MNLLRRELSELEQRVKDMFEQDKITGEHKDATPLDYVRWAIEEVELNKETTSSTPHWLDEVSQCVSVNDKRHTFAEDIQDSNPMRSAYGLKGEY